MPQSFEKLINSVWLKVISVLVGVVFTALISFGGYHLNKLDGIVTDMQNDKVELIDRIDEIDSLREHDIQEVKTTVNNINATLREYIARTDETRLTTNDALQIWRQIATIKAQIIDMDEEIDRLRDKR